VRLKMARYATKSDGAIRYLQQPALRGGDAAAEDYFDVYAAAIAPVLLILMLSPPALR